MPNHWNCFSDRFAPTSIIAGEGSNMARGAALPILGSADDGEDVSRKNFNVPAIPWRWSVRLFIYFPHFIFLWKLDIPERGFHT